MMQNLWTYVSRTTLVIGVLLTFIAVAETLDFYLSLRELSPALGSAFAAILTLLLVAGAVYLVVAVLRRPRVLNPPPTDASIRTQARYLARYSARLSSNPLVAADNQAASTAASLEFASLARGRDEAGSELRVEELLETVIEPIARGLDEQAEAEVRRSVLDVMVGVTLSPYHIGDLFIVLYRNGALFLRVVKIYGGRPRFRENVQVAKDVLQVVAAVNLLNFSKQLIESMLSRLPFIGWMIDDLAQGVAAGFLTSTAGHAAISRCHPHRAWNEEAAIDSTRSRSPAFLAEVRDIFTKEVWPNLRSRISTSVPKEESESPGFWERMSDGVESAIDSTSAGMGSYLIRPTLAGSQAVADSSAHVGRAVGRYARRAGTAIRSGFSTGRAMLTRTGRSARSVAKWRPTRQRKAGRKESSGRNIESVDEPLELGARWRRQPSEDRSEGPQPMKPRKWIRFRGKATR